MNMQLTWFRDVCIAEDLFFGAAFSKRVSDTCCSSKLSCQTEGFQYDRSSNALAE